MIIKVPDIIRASDFRQNLAKYLKRAEKEPIIISTDRGGATRVVIDRVLYNTLVQAYEDERDASLLSEMVSTKKGKLVSWKRTDYGV